MEKAQGAVYDLHRYDPVWKRVSPGMDPYAVPAQQGEPQMTDNSAAASAPGAEVNPCCMGSDAEVSLGVLDGFIEEEMEGRRAYLALANCAPVWARENIRSIAAVKLRHARRLMAMHYLITAEIYRPAVVSGRPRIQPWPAALRDAYHRAACNAFNYGRAAEGTLDPCLSRMWQELSTDQYGYADRLVTMLERALR